MNLASVSSKLELSPRNKSLAILLAVQDISVQRSRTGHSPPIVSENLIYPIIFIVQSASFDAEADVYESLMYSLEESTKILLAVGRKETGIEFANETLFR